LKGNECPKHYALKGKRLGTLRTTERVAESSKVDDMGRAYEQFDTADH